jgi:hypothetical protein
MQRHLAGQRFVPAETIVGMHDLWTAALKTSICKGTTSRISWSCSSVRPIFARFIFFLSSASAIFQPPSTGLSRTPSAKVFPVQKWDAHEAPPSPNCVERCRQCRSLPTRPLAQSLQRRTNQFGLR